MLSHGVEDAITLKEQFTQKLHSCHHWFCGTQKETFLRLFALQLQCTGPGAFKL